MKHLKLTLNIGTRDATALGLDPAKATEGAAVSVKSEVADELLKRGWATEPDSDHLDPEAKPSTSATPKVGEAQKSPAAEKKS